MRERREKTLVHNRSSMAANWVKSLHCKSRAFEDVHHSNPTTTATTTGCRNSFSDVIRTPKSKPKPIKPDPSLPKHYNNSLTTSRSHRVRGDLDVTALPLQMLVPKDPLPRRSDSLTSKPDPSSIRVNRMLSDPDDLPFFPSVSDLPEGHPSRNVVEIIFQTRWGPKPFPGRVEMVFKVQNPAREAARFEAYRDSVRAAGASDGDGGRFIADGNEMMRFRCLGAGMPAGIFAGGSKGSPVSTYSGSGKAHESGGGGRGRRAMLVCRVIAGRVGNELLMEGSVGTEFDSVKGEDGELIVFDSRAILPCFLVIYKL